MFVLSAGALAGVLIWSKLRLVTDIPRSAYAEPENNGEGKDRPWQPDGPDDAASPKSESEPDGVHPATRGEANTGDVAPDAIDPETPDADSPDSAGRAGKTGDGTPG